MGKKYGPEPQVFSPKNVDKYKGKIPIILRSSLELRFAILLDRLKACVQWGSETNVVPYYDPSSKMKKRRYIVDFYMVIQDPKSKKRVKYYVEIKPYSQCLPPKNTKRKKPSTYMAECLAYATNQAKWKAAADFAQRNKGKFIVVTEKSLASITGNTRY